MANIRLKREEVVGDLKRKQLIMKYIHKQLELELAEEIDDAKKGLTRWKLSKCRYFWKLVNEELDKSMSGSLDKTKRYRVGISVVTVVPQDDAEFDKPHYDKWGNTLDTDPYREFKKTAVERNINALKSLLFTARTREWEKAYSISLGVWQKQAKIMKEYIINNYDENSFLKMNPVAVITV